LPSSCWDGCPSFDFLLLNENALVGLTYKIEVFSPLASLAACMSFGASLTQAEPNTGW
jgi:hypothetical protein